MEAREAARRVRRVAEDSWYFRRFELMARGVISPRRPLALSFGNCQAEPLRQILGRSQSFAELYETIRVPPAHTMTRRQVALLRHVLPKASLLVGQPVSNNYRNLALGTDQISALLPKQARVVKWPALYWDGIFPFIAYVHIRPRQTIDAPITVYHDLRLIASAHRGYSADEALKFLADYKVPDDGIDFVLRQASRFLGDREEQCDVRIMDYLQDPDIEPHAFYVVNHPRRFVLERIASEVHQLLGLVYGPGSDEWEPLGDTRAPIELDVLRCRGLVGNPHEDWIISGRSWSRDEIVRSHLDWYAVHQEAVVAGVSEHSSRLTALGLL
jgi:hypothetical protein